MNSRTILFNKCMHSILLPFLISISTFSFADNIYKIEKLSSDGIITISLLLPAKTINTEATKLSIRNNMPLSTSQIKNVRCGNKQLKQDDTGYWWVPSSCNKVVWDVVSKQVDDETVDIADQLTLKLKKAGWILFSEPTSLLRINDNPESLSLLVSSDDIPLFGATAYNKSWLIPSEDNAPEFFIIGNPVYQIDTIGQLTAKYVIDDPHQSNWAELRNSHKNILLYFINILSIPSNLPKNERTLLIVWIGINAKDKQINGAAGRRSFIANYVIGKNEQTDSPNNIHNLLVLAHEQFHQLVQMVRFTGSGETSVWIEESLAQYYAIKSLQSLLSDQDFTKVIEKYISFDSVIKFTELEQQIKEGNYKNYSLFYSQGAHFWYEFDQALLTSSEGKYGLDFLLNELITSESKDGQLSEAFLQKAKKIGGKKIDNLLSVYIN